MIRFIVLCVVSLLFTPDTERFCIEDSCDYIEINDFGGAGESRKQIIFWEWRERGVANIQRKITGDPTGLIQYGPGFAVVEYKMIRSDTAPLGTDPIIEHDFKKNLVRAIFWDGRGDVMRKITAKWIIYTKCPDPEQANLKVWAKDSRKGLTAPPKSN